MAMNIYTCIRSNLPSMHANKLTETQGKANISIQGIDFIYN